jgi:PKD repeat protein
MAFSNLTSGSLPLAVRWDFGDGYGYSSETNPQYRYSSAGHMTATLEVTNTLGTSSARHRVEVGHLTLYLPLVQK